MGSFMCETDALIHEFWSWFQSNTADPVEDHPSDELNAGIGRWMDRLGVPDWEIGPIGDNELFLAVSPGGDPARYDVAKHIVALAPSIVGWRFLPARPRKDWNRVFLWSIRGEIDANLWKVVVLRYPDGLFELAFIDATMPQVPFNEKLTLTEFVLASEIGEDALITKICTISFETDATAEMIEASMSVSDIERAIGLDDRGGGLSNAPR